MSPNIHSTEERTVLTGIITPPFVGVLVSDRRGHRTHKGGGQLLDS